MSSYYKITFEANTIEGLKAIQGTFLGRGASAADSTAFETTVPPPPQQDEKNLDAFAGGVQPPPTADEAGASLDAFYPPPSKVEYAARMEGEIPPPPIGNLEGQEDNDAQPDEGVVPPPQSASKGPKANKKSSR